MKYILCTIIILPYIAISQFPVSYIRTFPNKNIEYKKSEFIDSGILCNPSTSRILAGRVIDGETMKPINFCSVTLLKDDELIGETETSVIGSYFLALKDTGVHIVKVACEDYKSKSIVKVTFQNKWSIVHFEMYLSKYFDWVKPYDRFETNVIVYKDQNNKTTNQ